jgi:lysophospholipase L1-like esterase
MRFLARAAAIVVLTLLLFEAVLRIHNPAAPRVRGDRILLPASARYAITNPVDPRLDRRVVQQRNALGFRGPDVPPDFASRLSIVAVGGSTTECLRMPDEKTWPAVMADDLAKVRRDVWVNNAGLAGHSTIGHLALLEEYVIPLHPRVVLFLTGINDVGLDRRAEAAPFSGWWNRVARYSEVANLALTIDRVRRARDLRFDDDLFNPRAAARLDMSDADITRLVDAHAPFIDGYRERLTALVDRSRAAGIEPILLTQPLLGGDAIDPATGVDLATVVEDGGDRNGKASWRVLEAYNDVARGLAAARGVMLIDLARLLPKDSRLFVDFMHFSNDGAAAVGHLVGGALAARFGSGDGV